MAEPLASVELIAEIVHHERELLFRHADSLDTKAGVVLGTSTATVAFAATRLSGWTAPGLVVALIAATICLPVFRPQRYPLWEVKGLRDRFADSEAVFTQLHILDTEIVMTRHAARALTATARRVEQALRLLLVAITLLVAGSMIESLWR